MSLIFHPFFFLSLYNMLTFKVCVRLFSETFKARMLKLGIHMDNEFCIVRLRIGLLALILPFFLSFKAKFVSQFSPELC